MFSITSEHLKTQFCPILSQEIPLAGSLPQLPVGLGIDIAERLVRRIGIKVELGASDPRFGSRCLCAGFTGRRGRSQGMSAGVQVVHGVCWRFENINSGTHLIQAMSTQPTSPPVPDGHNPELGSMYCADPNCEYCKKLRAAEEQIRYNTRRSA